MKPFPGKDVPIINKETGTMNDTWYSYFQEHQKLTQLPDISTTPPTNGQVLIWNSATLRWTPGAN